MHANVNAPFNKMNLESNGTLHLSFNFCEVRTMEIQLFAQIKTPTKKWKNTENHFDSHFKSFRFIAARGFMCYYINVALMN